MKVIIRVGYDADVCFAQLNMTSEKGEVIQVLKVK